jgi:phosphoserine phosphatase
MRTAVFFTLEDTLLRGEAQFSFVLWACCRGYLPASEFRRGLSNYVQHRLSLVRHAEGPGADGFAQLRGSTVSLIEAAAQEFFATKLAPRLRPRAQSLVAVHRRRGHLTVLMTPAAESVARPIAHYLRIDVLLATPLAAHGNIYTGHCRSDRACGAGKHFIAQDYCARFGAELSRSYAYASQNSDRGLLESVGLPIVANPDRRLRALARERGWRIIDLDAGEPELVP